MNPFLLVSVFSIFKKYYGLTSDVLFQFLEDIVFNLLLVIIISRLAFTTPVKISTLRNFHAFTM